MSYKLAKEHKRHYGFVKNKFLSADLHIDCFTCCIASSSCCRSCRWLWSQKRLWGGGCWRWVSMLFWCDIQSISSISSISSNQYHRHNLKLFTSLRRWTVGTSCYVPPNTCGWGYKNRTRKVKITLNEESHILLFFCRDKIQDAKHNGEKCAKLRIIEISEIINCNVPCELPGKV